MNLLKNATSLCISGCLLAFTPLVAGLGITVDYTDGSGEGFFRPGGRHAASRSIRTRRIHLGAPSRGHDSSGNQSGIQSPSS